MQDLAPLAARYECPIASGRLLGEVHHAAILKSMTSAETERGDVARLRDEKL
ncbi:MAG: hypothetical protein HY681_10385 [Chloroflexi bacterium]|nr:hypothetical protein [Chloroflexota bacterium]